MSMGVLDGLMHHVQLRQARAASAPSQRHLRFIFKLQERGKVSGPDTVCRELVFAPSVG
jgi:hypothetical protein